MFTNTPIGQMVSITVKIEIANNGQIGVQTVTANVPDFLVLEYFQNTCYNLYSISNPARATLFIGTESLIYMNRAAQGVFDNE